MSRMAWYRSSLVAKCRNRIASLTPQAAAMSLVRVPLNPCFEKRAIAWLSNWRRRSSEDRRGRGAGAFSGESTGTAGGVFTSKYSLNFIERRQHCQSGPCEACLPVSGPGLALGVFRVVLVARQPQIDQQ